MLPSGAGRVARCGHGCLCTCRAPLLPVRNRCAGGTALPLRGPVGPGVGLDQRQCDDPCRVVCVTPDTVARCNAPPGHVVLPALTCCAAGAAGSMPRRVAVEYRKVSPNCGRQIRRGTGTSPDRLQFLLPLQGNRRAREAPWVGCVLPRLFAAFGPHFSPGRSKNLELGKDSGARPFGRAGGLDSTFSTPTGRNAGFSQIRVRSRGSGEKCGSGLRRSAGSLRGRDAGRHSRRGIPPGYRCASADGMGLRAAEGGRRMRRLAIRAPARRKPPALRPGRQPEAAGSAASRRRRQTGSAGLGRS